MSTLTIAERLKRVKQEPPYGSPEHQKNVEWMIQTIESLLSVIDIDNREKEDEQKLSLMFQGL